MRDSLLPDLRCVVCEKDAIKPREVLYCESCEGLHHIDCGELAWIVRNGEDHAHWLCGNCYDTNEMDEQ